MTDGGDLNPRETLAAETDIARDDIAALDADVHETVSILVSRHDDYVNFDRGDHEAVAASVTARLCREVFTIGRHADGTTPAEDFANVRDDFTDPTSSSAIGSVSLMLGKLSMDPATPDAAHDLANALVAKNYDYDPDHSHD